MTRDYDAVNGGRTAIGLYTGPGRLACWTASSIGNSKL